MQIADMFLPAGFNQKPYGHPAPTSPAYGPEQQY